MKDAALELTHQFWLHGCTKVLFNLPCPALQGENVLLDLSDMRKIILVAKYRPILLFYIFYKTSKQFQK